VALEPERHSALGASFDHDKGPVSRPHMLSSYHPATLAVFCRVDREEGGVTT
jgi:hypothetical protein